VAGAALSMSCVRMRVASSDWCASRIVVSVISTPDGGKQRIGKVRWLHQVASSDWCASRIVVSVISTPEEVGTAWNPERDVRCAAPPGSSIKACFHYRLSDRAKNEFTQSCPLNSYNLLTPLLAVLPHSLGPGLGALLVQVVLPACKPGIQG